MKWKYFLHSWPFVKGIHRSPVNSPHKGQWRGALRLSLICAWTSGWVNNQDTGELRCHCTQYDITVMQLNVYPTTCETTFWWFDFNKSLIHTNPLVTITKQNKLKENTNYIYHVYTARETEWWALRQASPKYTSRQEPFNHLWMNELLLLRSSANRQQLTHLLLDNMAAILQTIFSEAFSWMKSLFLCFD